MPQDITFTLIGDGRSDSRLMPMATWLVAQHSQGIPISPRWADPSLLPPLRGGLKPRVNAALSLYPCDFIVVHRDAERQPPSRRHEEIKTACEGVPKWAPLVTIRMQEAWLLFDERAIRRAASNPNGSIQLALPRLDRCEALPDPKKTLCDLLERASELSGRRLSAFNSSKASHRVAELIDDYSPLRALAAFRDFEESIGRIVEGILSQK